MSRLRLTKKLQPAKKAWKSFSNTLKSKVHELNNNIPKAVKAAIQRLASSLHSLSSFIPSNSRAPRSIARRYSTSYYQAHQRRNFSAIRIDELFARPSASNAYAHGETSGGKGEGKEVVREKDQSPEVLTGGGIDTIEDAWKVVVARSPQLQVDQKAEEFINKFRQDMKLQKEMSLLEFQQRLARGA